METGNPARQPFSVRRRALLAAAGVAVAVTGPLARSAAAETVGTSDGASPDSASNPSFPPKLTVLQPGSAAAVQALLDYDPAADPNARYLRSRVPIAPRIAADRAAQADPALDPRTRVLSLDFFYGESVAGSPSVRTSRYGFDRHPVISRFSQYHDIRGGWASTGNIPNPGYIDNAHRNGIPVIGTVFQPYFAAAPGTGGPDFLTRDADGRFAVGDKLVDLAAHFGFDGYFLNIEGKTVTRAQADDLAALLAAMHARADDLGLPVFHLQIYDALWTDGTGEYENRLDAHNAGWIAPGSRADSMFINYAWPKNIPTSSSYHHDADYVTPSVALAKDRGLDPFATVYFGLDVQEENDGRHLNALDYFASEVVPLNGAGEPVASLALFVPSSKTTQRTRQQLGDRATDPAALYPALDAAERRFWSGAAENPALPAVPADPTPEEAAAVDYTPRYGMADFVPERSVIGAAPFTTRFNTGQGDAFHLAGAPAGDRTWYHVGIQDILPTWQWWTRDARTGATGGPGLLTVDLDTTTAWDGGSCLRISGRLDAAGGTEARLFRTAVDAGRPLEITLTVREETPGAAARLRAGVSHRDAPDRTAWLEPVGEPADAGHGWRRLTFHPDPRHGAVLTALSVGVHAAGPRAAGTDYDIRIGELRLADRAPAPRPARPTGLRVVTAAPSATGTGLTAGLAWDPAADGVWYHDLRTAGPDPRWLGRILGDAYLLDELPPGTEVTLTAVGPDGTESAPAALTVDL